jgi:flagellar biosynthesis protein FlhF
MNANLQTFKAATMAEALGQVRAAMGNDAVILHTRKYQLRGWLGLGRREVVEITAGCGINVPSRATWPNAADVPAREPLIGLAAEVSTLKGMVKDLVTHVRQQKTPEVPEELFEPYLHLVENQISEDVAIEIIREMKKQLRPEHLAHPQFVREKIADQIERLLPAAGPIARGRNGRPHVVALIGPTGVGKTTTIAKLAANLQLREKQRLGLITIDTYRIAAVDQLKKYADILDSRLRIVSSPEDLRDAVASMGDCNFVLIDTAGRGPNDALKLRELKTFLAAAAPDEVHMVISTTASQECMELAIERFSDVRVDRLIFTKLDEAKHHGIVLNIARKIGKPISYITTGQDVPDDIEVAEGRRLAEIILGSRL